MKSHLFVMSRQLACPLLGYYFL